MDTRLLKVGAAKPAEKSTFVVMEEEAGGSLFSDAPVSPDESRLSDP
jgi:hypothetical protein